MLVRFELIERTAKHADGKELFGGVVRCLRCGHAVECFGARPHGFAVGTSLNLSKECPRRESNLYRPDGDTKQAADDWWQAKKDEARAAGKKGGKG